MEATTDGGSAWPVSAASRSSHTVDWVEAAGATLHANGSGASSRPRTAVVTGQEVRGAHRSHDGWLIEVTRGSMGGETKRERMGYGLG